MHGSPTQRALEPGEEADGAQVGLPSASPPSPRPPPSAGVIYCIEPLAAPDNQFVNTVAEAAAIVRAVASPALRTMIDCSAAGRAETQAIPELIDSGCRPA